MGIFECEFLVNISLLKLFFCIAALFMVISVSSFAMQHRQEAIVEKGPAYYEGLGIQFVALYKKYVVTAISGYLADALYLELVAFFNKHIIEPIIHAEEGNAVFNNIRPLYFIILTRLRHKDIEMLMASSGLQYGILKSSAFKHLHGQLLRKFDRLLKAKDIAELCQMMPKYEPST